MICSQCKTRNPIGNKFCRECGAKLVAPEGSPAAEDAARIAAARNQERVAALLTEAFALAEKDEPEKAIPLAEEAATLLPASSSAHALLAVLYERTEQEKKAIAAMERVVELNPASTADREKLEQLQRGVHVLPRRAARPGSAAKKKQDAAAPPAWLPVAAAVAVAALVLATGLSALQPPLPDQQDYQSSAELPPAADSSAGQNAPLPVAGDDFAAPPVGQRPDPFAPLPGSPRSAAATPPVTNVRVPTLPPPTSASTAGAPAPRRFAAASSGGARSEMNLPPLPITPGSGQFGSGGRIAVMPPSQQQWEESRGGAPVTIPVGPPGSAQQQRQSDNRGLEGENRPNGYIRISVGAPSAKPAAPRPSSAARPVPPPAPEPDAMTRAQALQSAGRYREAAAAYREAIREGFSAGDAYQGIALSHQRLGDDAAARAAYQQAIAAYEAQVASGRGVGAAQRALASCRAALEVLGGG